VAAATALFGWLVQPNAAVIHYTITNATATFDEIPESSSDAARRRHD
jgi:hypothetical protein